MTRRILSLTLVAVLCAHSTTIWAQDEDREVKKSETQILTEFLEAYKLQNWEKVEEVYDDVISVQFDALKKRPKLVYMYSNALFNQFQKKKKLVKKLQKADDAIDTMLTEEPKYTEAVYLLAQIRASAKSEEKKEQARDLLLRATQLGVPVLAQLQDKKIAKIFEYMTKEPAFLLKIMKAPTKTEEVEPERNFFIPPYRPDPTKADDPNRLKPDGTKKTDDPINKELQKQIKKLFKDIEDSLDRQEVDNLLPKFTELNNLMIKFGKDGSEAVRSQISEWQKRKDSRQFEDVQKALQLQSYVTEGNNYMGDMRTALDADAFDKVFLIFQNITALVDKMRSEDDEDYDRNAEALYFGAKSINDEAIKKKRIQELELIVEGIVYDPSPKEQRAYSGHRAIINNNIYKISDTILDRNENPIEDLRVKDIFLGSVQFEYKGTLFFRELVTKVEEKDLAAKLQPKNKK